VIDDTRLFIKTASLDEVRAEIGKFQQANTYDPPSKEDVRAGK
jgi:hypothetical protein